MRCVSTETLTGRFDTLAAAAHTSAASCSSFIRLVARKWDAILSKRLCEISSAAAMARIASDCSSTANAITEKNSSCELSRTIEAACRLGEKKTLMNYQNCSQISGISLWLHSFHGCSDLPQSKAKIHTYTHILHEVHKQTGKLRLREKIYLQERTKLRKRTCCKTKSSSCPFAIQGLDFRPYLTEFRNVKCVRCAFSWTTICRVIKLHEEKKSEEKTVPKMMMMMRESTKAQSEEKKSWRRYASSAAWPVFSFAERPKIDRSKLRRISGNGAISQSFRKSTG